LELSAPTKREWEVEGTMRGKQIRILIVDDFEMVRVMLKNTLNDLGHENIVEAEDGRVALSKLKEAHDSRQAFHLVFCDWNMPEVTGIEVLESCRAQPAFADLHFVMVTAEADQESVVRALRAGASDYIVKPISAEVLERKINRVIAKLTGAA
jgi:two-component system, chemotaxis family, chemotaxis protein CheY